jgi:hypothetical protein
MPQQDYPMSVGQGIKAEHTGFGLREYTSFASEIDLTEDGPTSNGARTIIVLEAGPGTSLIVEDQSGATRTISGSRVELVPIVCGINKIKVGTTVASVLAIW